MVSADYWLVDYPELRRTIQPSTIGGPLGEPGFCIFCSIACRLVGASYCLNQCLDIVNWALRNKLQWNINQNSYIFIQENEFKNGICKLAAILLTCHKRRITNPQYTKTLDGCHHTQDQSCGKRFISCRDITMSRQWHLRDQPGHAFRTVVLCLGPLINNPQI